MAVITISKGAYSRGREIAEKVAAKLSYRSISKDLLHEVSKDYLSGNWDRTTVNAS